MTEPSDDAPRRRPRRRRSSRGWDRYRRASSGRRAIIAGIVIAVLVFAAAGLSIALSGGPAPSGSAPAPTETSDLPLLTVAPTFDASLPPVATPSPSATANPGIRADRIQIERLGIDLKIVDGDGVGAPMNKAAHYPESGWPDGGTNIYIYGHAQVGMFLALWKVAVGDTVVLTLVDGTQRTYIVDTVLPKVAWNALEYTAPTPTEQLTLQTSTSYHPTSPRFIAIAHPAP